MTVHIPYSDRFIRTVEQIDWNAEQPEHHCSNIRLLQESAIRFARWTKHVEAIPNDVSPPFFDIAWCLVPDLVPLPSLPVGDIGNVVARRTLPWMHKWYWVLDSECDVELEELDPFEPLLLCFQRGGRPHYHHGFLHIEHSISFPVGYDHWPENFVNKVPIPLSEIDLQKIDADFKKRRSSGKSS